MTDASYPETSESTLALILGILTFLLPVLAPFAWFYGQREVRSIDAGQRDPANRSGASFARIVGKVVTILVLSVLAFVVFAVVFGVIFLSNQGG